MKNTMNMNMKMNIPIMLVYMMTAALLTIVSVFRF